MPDPMERSIDRETLQEMRRREYGGGAPAIPRSYLKSLSDEAGGTFGRGAKLTLGLVGDKELIRKLMRLEQAVAGDIARDALRVGGTIVLKAMRQTVPVDEGDLRRSLKRKAKTYRRSGVSIAVVGPEIPMGAHGHLLESGTVERVQQKTGRRVGRGPALHWMERAFEASKMHASIAMADKLASRLRALSAV